MKRPSIFPSLPKNLTVRKLRQEIRRRMKIMDRLGLIRKPSKWSATPRPGLATLAKSHRLQGVNAADCTVAYHSRVLIIQISSTVDALNRHVRLLLRWRLISKAWSNLQFSLEWLSQSGDSGIRCFDVFAFNVTNVFASPWMVINRVISFWPMNQYESSLILAIVALLVSNVFLLIL